MENKTHLICIKITQNQADLWKKMGVNPKFVLENLNEQVLGVVERAVTEEPRWDELDEPGVISKLFNVAEIMKIERESIDRVVK